MGDKTLLYGLTRWYVVGIGEMLHDVVTQAHMAVWKQLLCSELDTDNYQQLWRTFSPPHSFGFKLHFLCGSVLGFSFTSAWGGCFFTSKFWKSTVFSWLWVPLTPKAKNINYSRFIFLWNQAKPSEIKTFCFYVWSKKPQWITRWRTQTVVFQEPQAFGSCRRWTYITSKGKVSRKTLEKCVSLI